MNQSPGSRRSRRRARFVGEEGNSAEVHINNQENASYVELAQAFAQRAVDNNWINPMPDPNVADFTYVGAASIPRNWDSGIWHQLDSRYKRFYNGGVDTISEEELVKIKNSKVLVLTGMIKVPISIKFDSSVKNSLKQIPPDLDLESVDLKTIFPHASFGIVDSTIYVNNLSDITIAHKDEASGLKFESEPVSPTLDLQMIVSFIEELDVETQKALKAHLLSQVKF